MTLGWNADRGSLTVRGSQVAWRRFRPEGQSGDRWRVEFAVQLADGHLGVKQAICRTRDEAWKLIRELMEQVYIIR